MEQVKPMAPAEEPTTDRCKACGNDLPITEDGLCDNCDVNRLIKKQREEARAAKQKELNVAARAAFEAEIGAEAVRDWTFNKFQVFDETTKKALEAAQAFQPSTTSIYWYGMTGSGKSHLTVALASKFFDAGYSVRFFVSGDKFSRYLRFREPDEEDRRVEELASCDVLAINEIGLGAHSEKAIQSLTEVLDRRIMKGKRGGLIITSNFDPDALAEHFKEPRIRSRIFGLCKIIKAGEKDYREMRRKA